MKRRSFISRLLAGLGFGTAGVLAVAEEPKEGAVFDRKALDKALDRASIDRASAFFGVDTTELWEHIDKASERVGVDLAREGEDETVWWNSITGEAYVITGPTSMRRCSNEEQARFEKERNRS